MATKSRDYPYARGVEHLILAIRHNSPASPNNKKSAAYLPNALPSSLDNFTDLVKMHYSIRINARTPSNATLLAVPSARLANKIIAIERVEGGILPATSI